MYRRIVRIGTPCQPRLTTIIEKQVKGKTHRHMMYILVRAATHNDAYYSTTAVVLIVYFRHLPPWGYDSSSSTFGSFDVFCWTDWPDQFWCPWSDWLPARTDGTLRVCTSMYVMYRYLLNRHCYTSRYSRFSCIIYYLIGTYTIRMVTLSSSMKSMSVALLAADDVADSAESTAEPIHEARSLVPNPPQVLHKLAQAE